MIIPFFEGIYKNVVNYYLNENVALVSTSVTSISSQAFACFKNQ